MNIFNGNYLSDQEIIKRAENIVTEYEDTRNLLADPEVSTDPDRMPELAKRMHQLTPYCQLVDKFKSYLDDFNELKKMLGDEVDLEDEENEDVVLYHEYTDLCNNTAQELYNMLLENGYLEEEKEDTKDLEILKFIDYAGPEYAWRLGINVGLDVEESRERLDKLLEKGLLEKVQGTMLAGYHREKDWVKHMNHTYFKMSRQGKHYLRRLRREEDSEE
ncbi:MAG: DUF2250 domain-containing protein [Firmicutes bacterium]|nr:DUF2250 domain-containing protein [Bacillota bacterium]